MSDQYMGSDGVLVLPNQANTPPAGISTVSIYAKGKDIVAKDSDSVEVNLSDVLRHIKVDPVDGNLKSDREIEMPLNNGMALSKQHRVSSSGENIFFTNSSEKVDYFPVWSGIRDQTDTVNQDVTGLIPAFARVYEDDLITITPNGNVVADTDVAFSVSFNAIGSLVAFSISMIVAEAVTPSESITLRVWKGMNASGINTFEQISSGFTTGIGATLKIELTPAMEFVFERELFLEVRKGPTRDDPGVPLRVRSGDKVAGAPWRSIDCRNFVDEPIALRKQIAPINTLEHAFKTVQFSGEKGLPGTQGWIDSGTMSIVSDTVFGQTKDVVRYDILPSGSSSVSPLVAVNWVNALNFGASISGVSKIVISTSGQGMYAGMGFNTGNDPRPLSSLRERIGLAVAGNATHVKVAIDGNATTFTLDGAGGRPTILLNEYFIWEVVLDATTDSGVNFGAATLFVNGIQIAVGSLGATTQAIVDDEVSVSNSSGSGTADFFLASFDLIIYQDSATKTLTNADFAGFEETVLLYPPGHRDYVTSFADGLLGRPVGDKFTQVKRNIGGTITLSDLEVSGNVFIDGQNITAGVITTTNEISNVTLINMVVGANIWRTTVGLLSNFDIAQGDSFKTTDHRNYTPDNVVKIIRASVHGLNEDPDSLGMGMRALGSTEPLPEGSTGNTTMGTDTGAALTTGSNNLFFGFQAGKAAISAGSNVGMGKDTLLSLTTGSNNVALGEDALQDVTTSSFNVAIGGGALKKNIAAKMVAIGFNALLNNTGARGTAIGAEALKFNTGGNDNTAIGWMALAKAVASGNTALGSNAMGADAGAPVGNNNTVVGFDVLKNATSAADNVVIGASAALILTTGSRNILIGKGTETPVAGTNDHLNIGDLITGDLSAKTLNFAGQLTVADTTTLSDGGGVPLSLKEVVAGNLILMRYLSSTNVLRAQIGFEGNDLNQFRIRNWSTDGSIQIVTNGALGLEVLPDSTVDVRVKLKATAIESGAGGFVATTTGIAPSGHAGFFAPASFTLGLTTNNVERARITNLGNFLIGTMTDDLTNKLQVAGDAKITGNSTTNGFTTMGTGNVGIKVKKIVSTIPSADSTVESFLHGVDASKILGIQALANTGFVDNRVPSETAIFGINTQFSLWIDGLNIKVRAGTGVSSDILGRSLTVLITYEA